MGVSPHGKFFLQFEGNVLLTMAGGVYMFRELSRQVVGIFERGAALRPKHCRPNKR